MAPCSYLCGKDFFAKLLKDFATLSSSLHKAYTCCSYSNLRPTHNVDPTLERHSTIPCCYLDLYRVGGIRVGVARYSPGRSHTRGSANSITVMSTDRDAENFG